MCSAFEALQEVERPHAISSTAGGVDLCATLNFKFAHHRTRVARPRQRKIIAP